MVLRKILNADLNDYFSPIFLDQPNVQQIQLNIRSLLQLYYSTHDIHLNFEYLESLETIEVVIDALISNANKLSDDLAMLHSIALAYFSVVQGGGPFGSVITDDSGQFISAGSNHVTRLNDPTAHGEVHAIRNAIYQNQSLSGAILYTSCMTCPMCYGFAIDHNVSTIKYCSTANDAYNYAGFKDDHLWTMLDSLIRHDLFQPHLFRLTGPLTIVPVRLGDGQDLISLLQSICKTHGFEPLGLRFESDQPVALSLFSYMALRWANVSMPQLIYIQPFKAKIHFDHYEYFSFLASHVLSFYRLIPTDSVYGQQYK